MQNQTQLTRTSGDDEVFFFFFRFEEIKKKEVSDRAKEGVQEGEEPDSLLSLRGCHS